MGIERIPADIIHFRGSVDPGIDEDVNNLFARYGGRHDIDLPQYHEWDWEWDPAKYPHISDMLYGWYDESCTVLIQLWSDQNIPV